jgi:hypothetical protein
MTLQVLRDEKHKNRSRLVEFAITGRQVQSLNTIMSLAGIDKRDSWSPWGWDWDPMVCTCTIVQPWMYRGRIDHALRMFADKWHPTFRTALQIKQEAEA